MCGSDIFLGLIAILFPPVAVWVKRGICSADSFINIALCILGFLPGLLHAWYIISISPDPTYQQLIDAERAQHGGGVAHQGYVRHPAPRAPNASYGTVNSTPNAQFPVARDSGFVQPVAAGSNDLPPPTYAQAIKGDNKVQRS